MQTGVKLRPVRAGEPLFGLPAIALEFLACVCGVQPCPEQSTGERFVVGLLPLSVRDGLRAADVGLGHRRIGGRGPSEIAERSGSGAIGWGTGRRGVRQGTLTMRDILRSITRHALLGCMQFDMSARYSSPPLRSQDDRRRNRLEQFVNSLEGEIIAIVPNVSIGFLWTHHVDCARREMVG